MIIIEGKASSLLRLKRCFLKVTKAAQNVDFISMIMSAQMSQQHFNTGIQSYTCFSSVHNLSVLIFKRFHRKIISHILHTVVGQRIMSDVFKTLKMIRRGSIKIYKNYGY